MAKKSSIDHSNSRMHHAYAITGKVPGIPAPKKMASGGEVKEEDHTYQKYGSGFRKLKPK